MAAARLCTQKRDNGLLCSRRCRWKCQENLHVCVGVCVLIENCTIRHCQKLEFENMKALTQAPVGEGTPRNTAQPTVHRLDRLLAWITVKSTLIFSCNYQRRCVCARVCVPVGNPK